MVILLFKKTWCNHESEIYLMHSKADLECKIQRLKSEATVLRSRQNQNNEIAVKLSEAVMLESFQLSELTEAIAYLSMKARSFETGNENQGHSDHSITF